MKIVFLYSEVLGYTEGTFKALVEMGSSVSVVYWDIKKLTPFQVSEKSNVSYHPRSEFTFDKLFDFLVSQNPKILFVSGWMDEGYIHAAKRYKKFNNHVKVVCGIDDQWLGTLRQYLGTVYFRFAYRKLFDFMWVSGKQQFEYARRMGYGPENIIGNLYSANSYVFNQKASFTKRIVFLGRFAPVKGIFTLLDAYNRLPESIQQEWPLLLIGDGPLKAEIVNKKSDYVQIIPFLQPVELFNELKKGGVFCLPSTFEAWGVVIHEAAALGYPMVISSDCGAATEFLIPGYNGYLFSHRKEGDLHNALLKITTLNEITLQKFSDRSYILSQKINSETTAASLMSVLN